MFTQFMNSQLCFGAVIK